jgi:hypothetical protein
MNEETDRFDPSQKPDALKKLADHLSALGAQDDSTFIMESDMLSLIVSGTLNGEDISRRYPAFFGKLLENAGLRQAFLDALESVEAERAGELIPMPGVSRASLDFLTHQPASPIIENFDKQKWRAIWQRSLEQIQSIFSPPELAYRADPSLSEDPWFTLLREEMVAEGITYDVVLDCTLSNDKEDTLSPYLSLAVTLTGPAERVGFPLRASLQWGEYQESVLISDEGRVKFPDVPIAAVFDQTGSQPQSGFSLMLETAS